VVKTGLFEKKDFQGFGTFGKDLHCILPYVIAALYIAISVSPVKSVSLPESWPFKIKVKNLILMRIK
jgi:hypothetical protein